MERLTVLTSSVASSVILEVSYPSLLDWQVISMPIAIMLYDALDIDLPVPIWQVFDVLEDA